MNIAIIGATGLIGNSLAGHLSAAGHTVTSFSRTACAALPGQQSTLLDVLDTGSDTWVRYLAKTDIVINCVGVFANATEAIQKRVHVDLVRCLADACCNLPNTRLIHFSALAADENGETCYAKTKGQADQILLDTVPNAVILRPSLVFSMQGASTRLLAHLAQMPVSLRFKDTDEIQPVALEDLVRIVASIIEDQPHLSGIVEIVGPRKMSWSGYLATLRFLSPNVPLIIPLHARTLARLMSWLKLPSYGKFLNKQSLLLMEQGSHETGMHPSRQGTKDPSLFMDKLAKSETCLGMWRQLSIAALFFLWAFTALVSVLDFPTSLQLASMLSDVPQIQHATVWAGVALDAVMAFMTLAFPSRRLWRFQMVITLLYSMFIGIAEPAWLLHPFGPVTKNLMVLLLLQGLVWTEKK